jgi:hypothetical protein
VRASLGATSPCTGPAWRATSGPGCAGFLARIDARQERKSLAGGDDDQAEAVPDGTASDDDGPRSGDARRSAPVEIQRVARTTGARHEANGGTWRNANAIPIEHEQTFEKNRMATRSGAGWRWR